MRVGVVLIHFRTPELARTAVDSLRKDGAASRFDLDIVLVDNGSTPEGRRTLEALDGVQLIDPGANLGYAGGFNRGAEQLAHVDVLVVMNPDVRVLPGCLEALASPLERGAGVTGPRFWWDRPGGFQLPPTEERGRIHSLRRFLAPRKGPSRARRIWRRHARGHWRATEPLPSHALSGALLAIDIETWRSLGPFDDGYPLYFEETDWLERARRRGVKSFYVPGAEALHAYAQSTPKEPRSAAWFAESHRRFRRQHYGHLFTTGLESLARLWPEKRSKRPISVTHPSPESVDLEGIDWLEVAATPMGFPAAGQLLDGEKTWPTLPPGRYWVRGLRGEEERLLLEIENDP